MGDNVKEISVPLSSFIIKQCRRLGLFPDENTTVLSHGDELQVMQFCLACQNKKTMDRLEADSDTAVALVDNMRRSAWQSLEQMLLKSSSGENSLPDRHGASELLSEGSNLATASQAIAEDMQGDLQKNQVSPMRNQSSEYSIVLLDESECLTSVEAAGLAAFHDYKHTNNHRTLMDVYSSFITAVLEKTPELSQLVAASDDVDKLESDLEGCHILQTKIIRLVQGIKHTVCTTANPKNDNISAHISEEIPMHSCETSHESPLLSPKTPSGKMSASTESSNEKTPREAPTTRTPKTPFSPLSGRTLKEIFVEDLFRSYMHLLVNSRSQLALARIFNIPERDLNHEAFTHLKHESAMCGLSMYQTLSSFMLRIHLGGQGYAPTRDNPLMEYLKGLGSLLDMTQKLQTIVEEVPELRVACCRIVNVIKSNLIRCKSGKFSSRLVVPAADKISSLLLTIIEETESANSSKSKQQAVSQGSAILGSQCLRVIQQFLDRTALSESQLDMLLMSDVSFSSSTPTRFPCLLTQFRSPTIMDAKEDDSDGAKVNVKPSATQSKGYFVSAALHVDTEKSSELLLTQRTMSSIEVLPSKTIVHPRVDADEHTSHKTTSTNVGSSTLLNVKNIQSLKSKAKKRPATSLFDKENLITSPTSDATEPHRKVKAGETGRNTKASPKITQRSCNQEMTTPKQNKSVKSCRRRLLSQIKGQAKITGFFRM